MRILEVIGGQPGSGDPLENAVTNAIIILSKGYTVPEISKHDIRARIAADPVAFSSDEMAVNVVFDSLMDKMVKSHDENNVVLKSVEEQQQSAANAEDPMAGGFDDLGGGDEFGGELGGDEFGGGFGDEEELDFGGDDVEGVDSDVDRLRGEADNEAEHAVGARKKFSDKAVQ